MKLLVPLQRIDRILKNRLSVLLLLYWALTQWVVFGVSGVKTSVDTSVYLESARAILLHFKIEDAHDFWYVSYSTVLALILKFTDRLEVVVFFQILFSGLALMALHKAVLRISADEIVAFIAGFLYLFWFEIHTWNVFIYTESLFISCSVIAFSFLVHSRTYWQYGLTIVFLLFTSLLRPVGFSLLAASLCYFYVKLKVPIKLKILIGLIGSGLLVMLLNKMLESYALISSYAKGEIIYPDVSFGVGKIQIEQGPPGNYPLVALAEFIFHHPVYYFKLCAIKLALFFGHVKPYFSILHNGYIVTVLYPLYFFAFWACRFSRMDKPVLAFLVSFVSIQAVTVMLTTENWDGRFLLPALPFIFILSAFGLSQLLQTGISEH